MANGATVTGGQGGIHALIGGGIALLGTVSARFATGSPWTVIHRLSAAVLLPPLWILGILWFGIPTLCGYAAGKLYAGLSHAAEREAHFWRGCTCLSLSLMCAAAWYALLFGKCSLFFSGLCLLAAACLSFLCLLAWKGLSVGSTLAVGGAVAWYLLLFLLQCTVVLRA